MTPSLAQGEQDVHSSTSNFKLEDSSSLNLNLDHQNLSQVPDSIFVKNLVFLRLSLAQNHLTSLPTNISCLSQLRVLRLDHNELLALPDSICELQFLETLNVSNNKLSQLPKAIGQLRSLRYLFLSNNQISELPLGLVHLKQLKKISFQNNPLHFPPPHIWTPSPSSRLTAAEVIDKIMNYLHVASLCSQTSNSVPDTPSLNRFSNEPPEPFPDSVPVPVGSEFTLSLTHASSSSSAHSMPPFLFPSKTTALPWEDSMVPQTWDPTYALDLLRRLADEMETCPPPANEARALLQALISFSIGAIFLLSHVHLSTTFSSPPEIHEQHANLHTMLLQLTSLASLANKYIKAQSPGHFSWTSSAQSFHLLTKAFLQLSNSIKQILKNPRFQVHPRLMRHTAGIVYQCLAEFKVCAELLAMVKEPFESSVF
ncbi:hypothetical protein HMI54_001261 [Coelomomyces lativittatus]|nr:hypothetical protein HMI55_000490 [Coelomomyces lativittatus]KAJ1510916.1 hypothetical protein HMI54_001261 [Coelomomyces lativittatus]KAJ1512550.1 hypothetical protein HMI56_003902 [Coelomomyces lativittatus]